MTAVVSLILPVFNEICVVADTRVSYPGNKISPYGIQKLIPVIGTDKRSIGVIGFSGFITPVQRIVRHLIDNKDIWHYRRSFVVDELVQNLRGFIQEGFNNISSKEEKSFVMLFTTVDTGRQMTFKDATGNDIDRPLKYPIYLPRTFLFWPNRKGRIQYRVSQETPTIIGEGSIIKQEVDLQKFLDFGRPYDFNARHRALLVTSIISELFIARDVKTVGAPYWAWNLLDPERQSEQYWHWGYDQSKGGLVNTAFEQNGNNYIVTNLSSGEKRTVFHILNWDDRRMSAMM